MAAHPVIKIGRCDICAAEAVIVAMDHGTGLRAGRCCEQVLNDAHRFINLTIANIGNCGVRHPRPGEISADLNH